MDITFLDLSNLINRVVLEDEALKKLEEFPTYYALNGSAGNDDKLLDTFVDFLTQDPSSMLLPHLLKLLLTEELKQSTRSTLMRENSIGMALITKFWYNKEGRTFLQSMVGPLVNSIGKSPVSLEVDSSRAEKGVNVKANSAIILKEVSTFVNLLFEALENNSFPPLFKIMMQFIDSLVTIQYGDLGLSLVGGVLFLRLINPAIVLPHQHNLLPPNQLTIHGQKALLTISKILQRLANQEYFDEQMEPHMIFANRFIRKTLPQWTRSFHKFMTGGTQITGNSSVSFNVLPEDLISQSNMDIHTTLICPVTKSKQREALTKMFHIEKETTDWKEKTIDNCKVKFKRYKGTGVTVTVAESIVNGSVKEITEQLKKINSEATMIPGTIDAKVLKVYNENLSGMYALYKTPTIFDNRDFVFLNYHESIPEENFSIFCEVTIDDGEIMKLVPENIPKAQRGEFYSGCIIRGTDDPNKSRFVSILHADIKGNSACAPTFALKSFVVKAVTSWSKMLNNHFSTTRRNSVV